MGLFDLFKRKPKAPGGDLGVRLVAHGIEDELDEMDERAMAEQERIMEEEAARRRRLQEENRRFLEANGVNVEMFDGEKAISDTLEAIEAVCPCMLRFDRGLSRETPLIYYSSPTKTGKVPKNVVEAHLCHDEQFDSFDALGSERSAYISAKVSYLRDGRVNKIDLTGNYGSSVLSVAIRRSGDALVLTGAGTYGPIGDWQSLCPCSDQTPTAILAALNEEVRRIF